MTSLLFREGLQQPACIENAADDNDISSYSENNAYPSLEPDDANTGTEIRSRRATLRKSRQGGAPRHDAIDIGFGSQWLP